MDANGTRVRRFRLVMQQETALIHEEHGTVMDEPGVALILNGQDDEELYRY